MTNPSAHKPTAHGAMVIGIELPGFAKRSVAEQFKQREQLQHRLSGALKGITHKDRIVVDTSNGAAVVLFGSAPTALCIATSLCGTRGAEAGSIAVRASLAVGPIQAINGEKGEMHMTGDALDVAERIIGLASSEKLVCTRGYADVLRRDRPECGTALKSLGNVTDTQIREHELFSVQLTHPSIHALRRKRGGTATRRIGWLSMPVGLTASAALGLAAYLWAASTRVEPASVPIAPVAAAPAPTISIVNTIPPQPLEPTPISVVDMKPSAEETAAPPDPVQQESPRQVQRGKARKSVVVAHSAPTVPARVPVTEQSIETHEVLPENPTQRGKILLAIAPWGEVLIDGKSVGISPPLTEMELPAGAHYVEVRNSAAEPVLRRVEVQANETLKIRHRFADSR